TRLSGACPDAGGVLVAPPPPHAPSATEVSTSRRQKREICMRQSASAPIFWRRWDHPYRVCHAKKFTLQSQHENSVGPIFLLVDIDSWQHGTKIGTTRSPYACTLRHFRTFVVFQ